MQKKKKVGFFDSGLGGLSIWKECEVLLPQHDTLYLADNKNAPYGIKSDKAIIDLSIKNTEFLLKANCDLIVVACNTATTAAIKVLRDLFDVPFVGIEPAIKPAAMNTKNNRVGVLATEGTLVSSLFKSTSEKFAKGVHVINQHGTGLVKLIEEGKMKSDEMTTLLEKLVAPLIEENIDYLVLGCTHYPFLIPQLKEILPKTVQIIDSGSAVARRVQSLLEVQGDLGFKPKIKSKVKEDSESKMIKKGEKVFYTNRSTEIMDNFMKEIKLDYKSQYKDF